MSVTIYHSPDCGTSRNTFAMMLAHPILINRPIVVTPKGTKLCRPSEAVLELLDHPVASFFLSRKTARPSRAQNRNSLSPRAITRHNGLWN
jgi:hypothetical protein